MLLFTILAILAIDAIIIFVIFIVRITIITVRHIRWRKFAIPTIGIVGALQEVTSNYNRKGEISSLRYVYAFKIIHCNQEFDHTYSENAKPNSVPITRPGKEINILWSASDHKYLQYAKNKGEIWQGMKQEFISSVTIAFRFLGRARGR